MKFFPQWRSLQNNEFGHSTEEEISHGSLKILMTETNNKQTKKEETKKSGGVDFDNFVPFYKSWRCLDRSLSERKASITKQGRPHGEIHF